MTCTQIEATSTGHFEVTAGGITINANVVHSGSYATNGGLRCTHASGTVTINGNVTAPSTTTSAHAVGNNGAGTLTIDGNVTGGAGATAHGLRNASTGTVNILHDVTAGSSSGNGLYNASTGTCNISGSVSATATGIGIYNNAGGEINITGDVTAGAGTNKYGAHNNGAGTINVSGTATGNANSGSYGVYNEGTGTVLADRVVAGSHVTAVGLYGNNSGGATKYKRIGSQANGNTAIAGFCKLEVDSDYNVIVVKDSAGNDVSMSNDYPAVTDVKSGVVYNRTTLTGTLAAGGGSAIPGISTAVGTFRAVF